MNPALLATLGTLAETASLKADILPPVSGENAPAFTLPKMAVARWRSAFIALKPVSNRRRARRRTIRWRCRR